MRRCWIALVSLVAVAGLVAGTGTAYAGSPGSVSTSACSQLVQRYQKVSQSAGGVDFTKPKAVSAALKQAASDLRALVKAGPSALRVSFRRLAAAYDRLAKLDYSRPASFNQLTSVAETLSSDFQKIAAYAATKCGFTIPTAGSSSTPTS